eukprot:11205430-Lingulodinium_polyedra.AAC.1
MPRCKPINAINATNAITRNQCIHGRKCIPRHKLRPPQRFANRTRAHSMRTTVRMKCAACDLRAA